MRTRIKDKGVLCAIHDQARRAHDQDQAKQDQDQGLKEQEKEREVNRNPAADLDPELETGLGQDQGLIGCHHAADLVRAQVKGLDHSQVVKEEMQVMMVED